MGQRSQLEQLPLHELGPEPVLMPLYLRNYRLIRDGSKRFEFRKRYVQSPTRWYVCIAQPVWQVVARIQVGMPCLAPIEQLVELLDPPREETREGIRRYFRDYSFGYALPIESVEEFEPVRAADLPDMSRVPNDYVPLRLNARALEMLDSHFASTRIVDSSMLSASGFGWRQAVRVG